MKLPIGQNSEICEFLLLRHNALWELNLQSLGKYECLKQIYINFWNRSIVNFVLMTADHKPDSSRKVSANSNVWVSMKFHSKKTSFQAIKLCSCFIFILHLLFYACFLLFSRFLNPNTDRQQSHYSDRSKFSSICIVFIFLQSKHLNYIYSFTGFLLSFLQTLSAM